MFEITIFCLYNLSLSILWDRTSSDTLKLHYLFPYYAHINDQYKYNLENQKSFSYKMAFLWIKNKVLYWLSIFFLVIVVVTAVVIFWTKKILVSVYTANYMLCYPPQSTHLRFFFALLHCIFFTSKTWYFHLTHSNPFETSFLKPKNLEKRSSFNIFSYCFIDYQYNNNCKLIFKSKIYSVIY